MADASFLPVPVPSSPADAESLLNPRGTTAVVNLSAADSKALSVRVGGAEVAAVSSAGVLSAAGIVAPIAGNVVGNVTAAAASAETITGNVANSGTNVNLVLDSSVALSGTTKLVSFRNHAVEKASMLNDGTITAPTFVGALTGNASTATNATTAAALVTVVAPSLSSGDGGAAGTSATVNKAAGTLTLASGSAAFTLTNSLIVAGVKVFAALNTDNAAGKSIQSIVIDTTAHTAVITLTGTPNADISISFFLIAFA